MSNKVHPAVQGFMEAVYPGNAELALSCFNEIKALTDATETINTLRFQRDALREALKKISNYENPRVYSVFDKDEMEDADWKEDVQKIARTVLATKEPV